MAERLKIFWTIVYKIRELIMLRFGYDPKLRNIGQSPFHGNEAGIAACNTLALEVAPTAPLIGNHAAARERGGLYSATDSSEERIREEEFPGFEFMFKCEGKAKRLKLQEFLATKDLPFKVSVVTGPSGSYREHDVLNFLGKWLNLWGQTESGEI